VHTGLDRVMWDNYQAVRGRRIALLTNHAAVDTLGRHIIDVLQLGPDVMLTRLFSPEHGIRGQAEAGEAVPSESGPIPVTSLYGARKRPSADELAGIELFLVDLPDIGARYYTYMNTMKECIVACAEAGVPVLVLDRPNPLGGAVVEGPVAEDVGSPVCSAPVPVRHAMTLGELALLFQEIAAPRGNLTISPCDNWPRERVFAECGLPWIAPSPNIPSPESALLYVGNCLFEGVNLNEGRGTETPFQLIGAPWLDADRVLDDLDDTVTKGCRLEAMRYTPRAIPGKASNPAYQDTRCEGIRIAVADWAAARPFSLAVSILSALQRRHGAHLEWNGFFDTLAGGTGLRERIQDGTAPQAIIAEAEPELDAFRAMRPSIYNTTEALLETLT